MPLAIVKVITVIFNYKKSLRLSDYINTMFVGDWAFYFAMVGIKSKASCMVGKESFIEPHPRAKYYTHI